MYPLPAVLVNCSEPELPHLREALADNAVTVVGEHRDSATLLAHWVCPPDPKPRLIVVRLGAAEDVQHLARLDTAFPGWPVLALVEGDYDASSLFAVSRAGAAQILPVSCSRSDLDVALDRVLTQFGVRKLPSRLIAVTGIVEGCGATTTAINLADELASAGYPVILVELGPGPGRLCGYLDLVPRSTVRDLLDGDGPSLAAVQAALLAENDLLSILAGPPRVLDAHAPSPQKVQQLLHLLRHLGVFVVLDLAYTYDPQYFEAVAAADHLVLVGRQDVPAVHAAKVLVGALADHGTTRPVLVLNEYDADRTEFGTVKLKDVLGVPAVYSVAHDRDAARRAANAGRPIREVDPHSPIVRDVRALGDVFLAAAGLTRQPHDARHGWARRVYDQIVAGLAALRAKSS